MHPRLLDSLLPRTRQEVLAAFLLRPERRWYRSALARHLGLTPSSLQRELEALAAAGILRREEEGRQVYFQADPDCPILGELRGILVKTAGLRDVVAEALAPFRERIAVAFVHGSLARGEEVSTSDVDLFVVGEGSSYDIATPLREAEERLGREIHSSWYSPEDLTRGLRERNHFLLAVLAEPKLFVVGSADDLAQVAGGTPGRGEGDQPARD